MTCILWVLRLISRLNQTFQSKMQKIYLGRTWKILTFGWRKARLPGFTSIDTALDNLAENLRRKELEPYQKEQENFRLLNSSVTKLARGESWNPLRRYPRNELCYCGSGVKYKKCHWQNEPLKCKSKDHGSFRRIVETAKRNRSGIDPVFSI